MNEENKISIVNNEYDYSNIIPVIDNVTYLVAFCDSIYNNFLKLIANDEEKNKPFKEEYKEYNFNDSLPVEALSKELPKLEAKLSMLYEDKLERVLLIILSF